jgi:hypothetical protein
MTHYQGEDIEFSLSVKQVSGGDLASWNDVERLCIYMYTHTNKIAKFSSKSETGYIQLVKSSNTMMTGVIPSEYTKVMEGALLCDVYIMPKKGSVEQIQRVKTGINIEYTPISAETI